MKKTDNFILISLFCQQVIADYTTPPQKELSRDLEAKLKPNITYDNLPNVIMKFTTKYSILFAIYVASLLNAVLSQSVWVMRSSI